MSNGKALYEETVAMRAACGDAKLKSILAIGELSTMDNVYKASLVCMMAGSDTIKVRLLVIFQNHVLKFCDWVWCLCVVMCLMSGKIGQIVLVC